MEFARYPDPDKPTTEGDSSELLDGVRLAEKGDAGPLLEFLDEGFFRHVHADWYDANHWIGESGAVTGLRQEKKKITGLLIIGADPSPAAWVRAAAFAYTGLSRRQMYTRFEGLLDFMRPALAAEGIETAYWMAHRQWTNRWMADIGYEKINTMVTFRKRGLLLPERPPRPAELKIRPVLPEDMRKLAEIEAATYAPMWRHSHRALNRAWKHALCFDVALWGGKLVGYQLSTASEQQGAHLARLSIHPDFQKRGIGTQLQYHAFDTYRKHGHRQVTLNTQIDNVPSQKLYTRLGFEKTRHQWPIWKLPVA